MEKGGVILPGFDAGARARNTMQSRGRGWGWGWVSVQRCNDRSLAYATVVVLGVRVVRSLLIQRSFSRQRGEAVDY